MELMQSFIYSISRVKLSLYEQRILVKVVEYAQSRVQGLLMKDNLTKLEHDFDNVHMVIAIKDLLSDGSQHYAQVRAAAKALTKRDFEYIDSATGDWKCSPIIYNVTHRKASGSIDFYVSRSLFDVILDFSKGFRQYSLETALTLSSPYAARLYSLMCGQTRPIRFEITQLKKMFGVEDKYSQTADFIKKVIEPSRKCLDEAKVTSFTFNRCKVGTKVTALMFFPLKRDEPTANQTVAKAPLGVFVSKNLRIMLMTQGQFTSRELSAYKVLLADFEKIPECTSILADIINRSITQRKAKGWIINAIRSEVNDFQRQQTMQ